jgi:hypothetical protein
MIIIIMDTEVNFQSNYESINLKNFSIIRFKFHFKI